MNLTKAIKRGIKRLGELQLEGKPNFLDLGDNVNFDLAGEPFDCELCKRKVRSDAMAVSVGCTDYCLDCFLAYLVSELMRRGKDRRRENAEAKQTQSADELLEKMMRKRPPLIPSPWEPSEPHWKRWPFDWGNKLEDWRKRRFKNGGDQGTHKTYAGRQSKSRT